MSQLHGHVMQLDIIILTILVNVYYFISVKSQVIRYFRRAPTDRSDQIQTVRSTLD